MNIDIVKAIEKHDDMRKELDNFYNNIINSLDIPNLSDSDLRNYIRISDSGMLRFHLIGEEFKRYNKKNGNL